MVLFFLGKDAQLSQWIGVKESPDGETGLCTV
jgi:hypothetical protein